MWIKCTDQMPKRNEQNSPYLDDGLTNSDTVLIYLKSGTAAIAYYCFEDGVWLTDDECGDGTFDPDQVLYWQPLPESPEPGLPLSIGATARCYAKN